MLEVWRKCENGLQLFFVLRPSYPKGCHRHRKGIQTWAALASSWQTVSEWSTNQHLQAHQWNWSWTKHSKKFPLLPVATIEFLRLTPLGQLRTPIIVKLCHGPRASSCFILWAPLRVQTLTQPPTLEVVPYLTWFFLCLVSNWFVSFVYQVELESSTLTSVASVFVSKRDTKRKQSTTTQIWNQQLPICSDLGDPLLCLCQDGLGCKGCFETWSKTWTLKGFNKGIPPQSEKLLTKVLITHFQRYFEDSGIFTYESVLWLSDICHVLPMQDMDHTHVMQIFLMLYLLNLRS